MVMPFKATIVINAKPRVVHTRYLTYQQLVELAFPGSQHPP
ncbi:multiubiquitin domain-containing protein [Pseudomonas sp.]